MKRIAYILCLLTLSREVLPTPVNSEDYQNNDATGFWNELLEDNGKAKDFDHWERIIHAASNWYDPSYHDNTQQIIDVQEYYRQVLGSNWGEDSEARVEEYLIQPQGNQAKVHKQSHVMKILQKPIPGRYIVMLESSANEHVLDKTITLCQNLHTKSEGRIRAEHITPIRSLTGFTATMNNKAVELMMKHPSLEVIEEDTALKLSTVFSDLETQSPSEVPWNLDRIDQRSNNLDGHYEPEGDGSNASIYVADTGVRYSHEEFEGRAHYAGFDAIDKLTGSDLKGADCEGHGTHCAGIAAGKTYGVAKKASIFSLRVLDCTGTGAVSGVIEGMGYVNQLTVNEMITSPVVLSMSLGSGKSSSFNTAIQQATSSGIVVVSAAGNEGGNSCKYSPASARSGIAVSATDKNDVAQSFSNAGKCIDIYAPGESIESAYSTCDTCRATLSGTSMSAPHVSGYIAIILSLNPEITSTDAKQKMIEDSTKNTVKLSEEPKSLIHDTPNRLLYVPHRN